MHQITVNQATENQIHRIKALYMEAFPKEERKPFDVILQKRDQGSMEILYISTEKNTEESTEEGLFAGLAITILHGDLALLDYFAVSPEARGRGVGSAALQQLFARYPGRRFLLEIESTRNCAQGDYPVKRKHFYTANGMMAMDYLVELFGVEMEIMTRACTVSFDEYHEIFEKVFGPKAAARVKRL